MFNRFEELRRKSGITKKFIADAIGRTPTVIQDWKAEKSEPNDEQIVIVADILHTTPAYLRGEREGDKESLTTDRALFALFGSDGTVSEQEKQDVLEYIEFVKSKRKKENK